MVTNHFGQALSLAYYSRLYFPLLGFLIDDDVQEQKHEIAEKELNDVEFWVRHYWLPGQSPRGWNREIYFEDMDSASVANWDSLSSKERVEAIRRSFLFDEDLDWDTIPYEEQERMLLDNAFIEWER